ncbi:hypothetical protein GP486_004399 [Trichoglossum hirsutum]|uniref:Sugar phosphate transporter domain-containing protein n=1 Tax=Trichoglossum hirsutum TaxID=265104 RepID=A0A9P8LBE8_9PEZI|nr:hypothetical protein GP486_004399 [Trichoglossum hirsutum]
MGTEEKARLSQDESRSPQEPPLALPVVSPAAEKPAAQKPSLPAAVYVYGESNLLYHQRVLIRASHQATTPVAVLLVGWFIGGDSINLKLLFNVSFIVIGVVIASFGEIKFHLLGFLYQCGGIAFEATRLVLVQKLLNGSEYKMDPLVSLYYFAPICTVMNFLVCLVIEVPRVHLSDFLDLGLGVLLANALVAFSLNVSAVFLIGKTSSLVLTLCGVLKDVLLVFASILIWGTTITGLQIFGYAIALGGLIYYKLGGEKLKELLREKSMAWSEYGNRRPIARRILTFAAMCLTLFLLAVAFSETGYYDYVAAEVKEKPTVGYFRSFWGGNDS